MLEYFAQGEGDAGGFQAGGGDLVHEGLELVVVMSVYEEYFVDGVVEVPGDAEAGESGAYDDDPLGFVVACCHGDLV